tara:strand:- start:76 stop:366 length:291 start_codon:yes stop_codon:yes gene_type:complete
MIKLKTLLSEKAELGGAALEGIRMLTDRNNHTRARADLARHVGDKRLIKAYEGLMYVEDVLRQANETRAAMAALDKLLFARAAKKFSNIDVIKSVF